MSCIDIAHEKKAAVFEPLLSLFWALLAELSRTLYLDFEIFGFIRIFEYPKFGFLRKKICEIRGNSPVRFFVSFLTFCISNHALILLYPFVMKIMNNSSGMEDRLEKYLRFIREVERLKSVERTAWTTSGRRESTAEHSWRLALLAAVLTGERPELDMQRVVLMCLIHDLGEAFDGDVPAIAQTAPGVKAASELAAMERLTRLLPPEAGATIREIWEEYEACQTPEARWVKALDKAETIIQHNQGANPAGFDYAFNLTYGSEYFDDGALLSDLRLLLDEETGRHVRR